MRNVIIRYLAYKVFTQLEIDTFTHIHIVKFHPRGEAFVYFPVNLTMRNLILTRRNGAKKEKKGEQATSKTPKEISK